MCGYLTTRSGCGRIVAAKKAPIGLARAKLDAQSSLDGEAIVSAVRDAVTTEDAWELLGIETLPSGLEVKTFISKTPGGGDGLLQRLRAAGLTFRWSEGKWLAEPTELARQHIDEMKTHREALYVALYNDFSRECQRLTSPVLARFTDPPTDRMNQWLLKVDAAERVYDLPRIKKLCGVKND